MQLEEKLVTNDIKFRQLLYGSQKTKKTWWAATAAEAGFNVILLDGDGGWQILKNINAEAQKRITVIDIVDTLDKAIFSVFLSRILKKGKIIWDEVEKKVLLQPNADCIELNLNKLTKNDVVIVDSWTALAWSLTFRHAIENQIDLTDPEKDDWDFYRWGGRIATWVASQLRSLPCHVIVIAHETNYDTRKKNKQTGKEEIVSSRKQIISTSGPQAASMGTYFSDIMHFRQKGEKNYYIEVLGSDEMEGGSRLIAPRIYKWEELTFMEYCKLAGVALPPEDNPYLDLTPKAAMAFGQKEGDTNTTTNKPIEVESSNKPKTLKIGLGSKK